jgi:hypothetical protein
MHLKSLVIIEKASISLKKSSERIKIFIKASHFLTKPSIFLETSLKSLALIMKTLHFSEIVFKKHQNRSKCLILLEKPNITLKKASISLEIAFKKIEINTKDSHSQNKKALRQLPQWPVKNVHVKSLLS